MGNRSTKASSASPVRRGLLVGAVLAMMAAVTVNGQTDSKLLAKYSNMYARLTENDTPANTGAGMPLYHSNAVGSPTADSTQTVLLVNADTGTATMVTYADLGNPAGYNNVFPLLAATHTWAVAEGGLSAFPTWEEEDPYSVWVLAPTAGKVEQAPVADLEGVTLDATAVSATDPSVLFPAVNAWCKAQTSTSYAGGYPTGGSVGDPGAVTSVEVVCLNADAARVVELPEYIVNTYHFYNNFPDNRKELLWTHLTAIADTIGSCTWLQAQWLADLKQLFFDTNFAFYELTVDVTDTTTNVMKSASSNLELNLADHSSDRTGPTDFRNIIIHGLVESVGYNHPEVTRTDAAWAQGNWACSTTGAGTPFPAYFQSAPLQAECCFSGTSTTPTYNGRADAPTNNEPIMEPGTVPDGAGTGSDGGVDTGSNSGVDTGSNTGGDTGVDTGSDGGVDTGSNNGGDTGSNGGTGGDDGSCTIPALPANYLMGTCNGVTLANGETCTLSINNPAVTFGIGYKCIDGEINVINTPINGGNDGGAECTLPATPSGYVTMTCVSNTLPSGAKCILASTNSPGAILTYTCANGELSQQTGTLTDGSGNGGLPGTGAATNVQPTFVAFTALAVAAAAAGLML